MGKVNKEWTTKELKLLKTLRDHGLTFKEIGLLLGRGQQSINHTCRIHEIPKTNKTVLGWLHQFECDHSVKRAAEHFGVSLRTAKYWKYRLKREGYPIRDGRTKKHRGIEYDG